ncbi:MAG: UDP-N-acetylglucosamine 1-carboxyvinyltransferase [Clostridium sp.]|nr:UDP-N-acetylglucosamine 1-carboxyvinyltransferase [Clostridium sp.]
MNKIAVRGGTPLRGSVRIGGAKNAAAAILPATILAGGKCVIENVPQISDVNYTLRILERLGARVRVINKNTLEIDTAPLKGFTVTHELTRHMRASYYFLGALLGRFGKARVAMPGGCNLGVRPIDLHEKAFMSLGATVDTEENAIISVKAEKLSGTRIYFDVVSVGATANAMLAAVKAQGRTEIENPAKEPHIVDLANFLNSMGANIRGAGTDIIRVDGVQELHGCTWSVVPDQIEAGTYMVAAAATGGDVTIEKVTPKHLEAITAKLRESGAVVEEGDDSVRIIGGGRPAKCSVKTMPHPGFPTDMQPQMAVLLSIANGTSYITESIFDNRFRYVDQLARMGAVVKVDGKMAVIEGVDALMGAPVQADDLRAGAAMLIAGLVANGQTEIDRIEFIERGYEDVVEKLRSLGADIRYIKDEEAAEKSA